MNNSLLKEIRDMEDPMVFMSQFCDTPIYRVPLIQGAPNFTPIVAWSCTERSLESIPTSVFKDAFINPAIHSLLQLMKRFDLAVLETPVVKEDLPEGELACSWENSVFLLESKYDPDYIEDEDEEDPITGGYQFKLTCRGDLLSKMDSDSIKGILGGV